MNKQFIFFVLFEWIEYGEFYYKCFFISKEDIWTTTLISPAEEIRFHCPMKTALLLKQSSKKMVSQN